LLAELAEPAACFEVERLRVWSGWSQTVEVAAGDAVELGVGHETPGRGDSVFEYA